MSRLEILATGALATIQDEGRPGLAGLGVGVSGAADLRSLRLANRLLGNESGDAAIEVTFGGLALRARTDVDIALTGAPTPATVDGVPVGLNSPVHVPAGGEVRLSPPSRGVRTYLAVRGGIDVPADLGSRATDIMSGIGPAVLTPGTVLGVGSRALEWPGVDVAAVRTPIGDDLDLRVVAGPRHEWFVDDALEKLCSAPYEVSAESNRVGMRLTGPVLERSREEELPSEGVVRGSLQVPPTGQPTLFLSDHPVTGGYPVIGVVISADVDLAAQARPGQQLRLRLTEVGQP